MNVETITMPAHEARKKLAAYRRALHRRADDDYKAAARGYEELAKGRPLLDLGSVFRDVPVDARGRPRLAIARADRQQVRFAHWRTHDTATFRTDAFRGGAARARSPGLFRTVPFRERRSTEGWLTGHALVPMVPADARAAAGFPDIAKCFILWEVEEWADQPIIAQPDRDPFLLRHLGGDLYAILAAWDLTELERAVMAGRAR